ncbi:prolyl 3-hydroxylase /prolyl 3,4-dihydroxylase [Nematocida minor]|uniref:prolyl 3-hydroxylase /prolyl 3,4-dihydroxylase n=1 Tax=Nematocida minor TaxID=1912983 RepID=UPI00221E4C15|nr:prolyl 3-hydroxylase /prolyl 3,4-dihydroxylase [Nematocida minor]XP_051332037.1 prolyl 3-hydroxylase /prolyl 3,4-dihydroxylase [Nematocida minor]KAI5188767.1 prolyl 3-hydroxylase /prolyl 3,4-dihydroxylase [Nematocida minor]KAI5188871.1 prolyl 3-hydroxylase /prolyl 3,4-dihydroxylase [Nematocida minor]
MPHMQTQEKTNEGAAYSTTPFYHRVVDGFLPQEVLSSVLEMYKESEFYEKHSDLFHFYQTNELKNEKRYQPFLNMVKNEMKKDLQNINKEVHSPEMDLFASFYAPGHFLLPHDDCVSQRVLAFSFYLNSTEDENSAANSSASPSEALQSAAENKENSETCCKKNGKLVLYAQDGKTVAKRIATAANRLVIFEVSGKSYHEVEMMTAGRRSAFTGWMRSKEHRPKSIELSYHRNRYWFFHMEYMINVDLKNAPVLSSMDECNTSEYIQKTKEVLEGLEWKRRLNCIYGSIDEPEEDEGGLTEIALNVTAVTGKTVDSMVGRINKESYLLLNDPFNTKSDFLVVLSLYNGDINIVNPEGDLVGSIKKPGYYIWPAPGALFIPPSESEGYIVAYRMNALPDSKTVE